MSLVKKALLAVAVLVLSACATRQQQPDYKDASANAVKITNIAGNHGGTGIILKSSQNGSLILTNSHVCGVVEKYGGLVSGQAGSFMVVSYKKSETADLCLIRVAGNLHGGVKLANRAPVPYYEGALISGHPSLYPNVKTIGHFSGRQTITILVDFKPCTDDDVADSKKGLYCLLLGGLPVLKQYDSVLVTATISPGSSGSAVYNEDMELSGVVFAGSGDIGYAWTVPYEYVRNFILNESKHLPYNRPSNVVNIFGEKEEAKEATSMEKLQNICDSDEKNKVKQLCEIMQRNLLM
jgi:S1-C subfamily serine protease